MKELRFIVLSVIMFVTAFWCQQSFGMSQEGKGKAVFPKEWQSIKEDLEKDSCLVVAFSRKYGYLIYGDMKDSSFYIYRIDTKMASEMPSISDHYLSLLCGISFGVVTKEMIDKEMIDIDKVKGGLSFNIGNTESVVNISPDGSGVLYTRIPRGIDAHSFSVSYQLLGTDKYPRELSCKDSWWIPSVSTYPCFETDSTFSVGEAVLCDRQGKVVEDEDVMEIDYYTSEPVDPNYYPNESLAFREFKDSINELYHPWNQKIVYNMKGELLYKSPVLRKFYYHYFWAYPSGYPSGVCSCTLLQPCSPSPFDDDFDRAVWQLTANGTVVVGGSAAQKWLLCKKKVSSSNVSSGDVPPNDSLWQLSIYDYERNKERILSNSCCDVRIDSCRDNRDFRVNEYYAGKTVTNVFTSDGKTLLRAHSESNMMELIPLGNSRLKERKVHLPTSLSDINVYDESYYYDAVSVEGAHAFFFSYPVRKGNLFRWVTYTTDGRLVEQGKWVSKEKLKDIR